MRTVQLGTTSVTVSSYCLGCNLFGSRVPRATAFQLLDHYADAGGCFVDTANVYAHWLPGCSGGESETLLGEWMRLRRRRLFVATKVGFAYGEVPQSLRAPQILTECDKSLRRLGVEAIDLYYPHIDIRDDPLDETLEAFNHLIRVGKVRHIGASNYSVWRLEEARWISRTNDWAEYCCVQLRHSYLRPKTGSRFLPQVIADDSSWDYCRTRGLTVLAYSPLLMGAYSREDRVLPEQYVGQDSQMRLAALRDVAAELQASANQVVLAWLMQNDPPVIPIVGSSSPKQLVENLGATNLRLSDDQIARLNAASG